MSPLGANLIVVGSVNPVITVSSRKPELGTGVSGSALAGWTALEPTTTKVASSAAPARIERLNNTGPPGSDGNGGQGYSVSSPSGAPSGACWHRHKLDTNGDRLDWARA